MKFNGLVLRACDKRSFVSVEAYIDFALTLLDARDTFVQATIVCQNEPIYRFYQLPEETGYAISRPINDALLCTVDELAAFRADILPMLRDGSHVRAFDAATRSLLNRAIYTLQQTIGIALDGLPAAQTNRARKVNGDLFERLVQLILLHMGVDCTSASIRVPVMLNGQRQFDMTFQHDLIVSADGDVRLIGSVKTSSKDRIGKIFVDKMMLNSMASKAVPHVAVFLNDVQRGKKTERSYKVSSTFLPGHFKAYTIKLNALDGVYYCDLRPNMRTDPLLSGQIASLDHLLCEDLWTLLDGAPALSAEIDPQDF